jgi:vanillate O-demethylase ferredoxin subunit
MCGPIRLMDAVRREWESAALPPANLRYETFGSSGWFQPEEFVVRVPQRRVETTVRTDETLLEALTRAGVDLMYDCRKGECGLCLLDVECVDGNLDHRDVFLSTAQQAGGRSVTTCVSRVASRTGSGAPTLSLTLP